MKEARRWHIADRRTSRHRRSRRSRGEADPGIDGIDMPFNGHHEKLKHGSVVIAAITSCTNTSNPSVMLAAGCWRKTPRPRD